MIVLPAIDLLNGQCVRLLQGAEKTAKIYSSEPAAMALKWQEMGSQIIHLVNLDGAFGRELKNVRVIKDILSTITIPVELGGGIRSFEDAENWLNLGVSRVIFGTVAITSPEIIVQSVNEFGADKVIVGIDARQDKVAIEGWEKQTNKDVFSFAKEMKQIGIERIIYTDVHRDGRLSGPNIENTIKLANQCRCRIIASGGFSRLEDFQALSDARSEFIEGAIVGKALYENKLDLEQLNRLFH
ncbi:1-(5-phosphoribosyl)-5-[(5-phosphoribosylamino)methylideneamino]imidazole-4-carboxamide isomerase [candidate division KSB1 bacterium]|nr:1-(5-phosphoribosyl)-5-[(5-phosphoribosylamino)methylideneamino]imidazole-4-carboxamide isomerase [candidate division KSB1 bacterium]